MPIVSRTGIQRERSSGSVKASVHQPAAVINFAFGREDMLFQGVLAATKPEQVRLVCG
ncbi:hypothetical protein [Sphingomonas sp. TDK1]|uniref:hypothetical protein n=1 Tax=Sphingomonas sp. TDK1 TaxID=453247 RepID=UPI0012EDD6B1|nr:hypothetical protein [Sphingomonas sp. TDK1]